MTPTRGPTPAVRIDVHDAHELADREGATVLDVVDTVVYDKVPQAIEGAVRIDPEDVPERYNELPKKGAVLTYCT
jgi:rhodanese-related sulfurtransferase